jgi:hypothetical protein
MPDHAGEIGQLGVIQIFMPRTGQRFRSFLWSFAQISGRNTATDDLGIDSLIPD